MFEYVIFLFSILLIKLNQHFSIDSTTNSITLAFHCWNQSRHISTKSSNSLFSEEYGILLKSVPYPLVFHFGLSYTPNSVYPVITLKIRNEEKRRSAYYFYEHDLWYLIVSLFLLGEISTMPWWHICRRIIFRGNLFLNCYLVNKTEYLKRILLILDIQQFQLNGWIILIRLLCVLGMSASILIMNGWFTSNQALLMLIIPIGSVLLCYFINNSISIFP